MTDTLNLKRIKFIVVSLSLGLFLSLSKIAIDTNMYLYGAFLLLFCLISLILTLEILKYKSLWLYASIIPLHLIVGAYLAFLGFPNLSLLFRVLIAFVFSLFYYITLLVLNIFVVIETRGKSIPLYRAANTWTQILIVVACIPLYAGLYKLSIHPFFQVSLVTISSFFLMLFFMKLIRIETGVFSFSLALLVAFWINMSSFAILFIPFEAAFRALFLSSIILFGLGFIQGYLKHTLTRKTLLEYLIITVLFLFLGLLFIP